MLKKKETIKKFTSEKDIFDFLGLQYKSPVERKDGRAVNAYMDVGDNKTELQIEAPTYQKAEAPYVGEEKVELPPTSMKEKEPLKDVLTKKNKIIVFYQSFIFVLHNAT